MRGPGGKTRSVATTLVTLVRLVDRPGSNDVSALEPGAVFGVLCVRLFRNAQKNLEA